MARLIRDVFFNGGGAWPSGFLMLCMAVLASVTLLSIIVFACGEDDHKSRAKKRRNSYGNSVATGGDGGGGGGCVGGGCGGTS